MNIHISGKYIIAFVAATVAINAVLYFYYDPVIQVHNPEAFTDVYHVIRDHNVQAVEGYGNAIIDKYGFHNDGRITPDSARIVCTGSSQTAAEHVATEKNYVSRLNGIDRKFKVYNAGVGGDVFADRFVRIIPLKKRFPVAHTLVFEINTIPSYEDLLHMREELEHNILPVRQGTVDKEQSIIYKIGRRIPFIRLMKYKYVQLRANDTKGKSPILSKQKRGGKPDYTNYRKILGEVLRLGCEQSGKVKLVLFCIPHIRIDGPSEISYLRNDDKNKSEIFSEICKERGITYIDMMDVFKERFQTGHQLPYGFLNSQVGVGHLNEYGHLAIAERLSSLFKE